MLMAEKHRATIALLPDQDERLKEFSSAVMACAEEIWGDPLTTRDLKEIGNAMASTLAVMATGAAILPASGVANWPLLEEVAIAVKRARDALRIVAEFHERNTERN
jgi:hypothetical protein